MKYIIAIILVVLVIVGLYFYYTRYVDLESKQIKSPELPSEVATSPDNYSGTIKLASWNIRSFSNKKRDDTELLKICRNLINYDFVALLEVRDEQILKRTENMLADMGKSYDYQVSDEVGRQAKERYAFLYDVTKIRVEIPGQVFSDPKFIRDPYFATFRSGSFDFTVIVTHILYGDKVSGRRAEIQHLAEVYERIKKGNPQENDVILVGDFNREPTDNEAFSRLRSIPSMTNLFNPPQKSIIYDSNLYDNIWFQTKYVKAYTGISGIDKFDEIDFTSKEAASRAVSDHRPVWAVFDTKVDGD